MIVFFILIFLNAMRMGRFVPSIALFDEDGRLTFFGYSLPWLAVVLFYVAYLLFFLYLASRRKMGSERIHPLSKPQAIAALASLSVLLLAGIWKNEYHGILEIVALYLLVITALLVILMVTPNHAEYVKGLWRAQKQGRSHLPWWDDLSINRVFLVIACTIVLAAATAAGSVVGDDPSGAFAAPFVARQFSPGHRDRRVRGRVFRNGASVFLASIRPSRRDLLCSLSVPGLARSPGGRHGPGDGVDAGGRRSGESDRVQPEPDSRHRDGRRIGCR